MTMHDGSKMGSGGGGGGGGGGSPGDDRSRTNLIINYLPQTFDTDDLRMLFEKVGPIKTHKVVRDKQTGASLCYGFVDFMFAEHAEKAINDFHGMRLGNKKLRVAYAATGSSTSHENGGAPRAERDRHVSHGTAPLRNPGNLYVSGIPKQWTESDLTALFSRFGKLVQIRVLMDQQTGESKGVGFVTFDDKSNAERAIQEVNGLQGPDWQTALLVKFAEDGSSQSRARNGLRGSGVGLSNSFNLPLDTGSGGLRDYAVGGRLSASMSGPTGSGVANGAFHPGYGGAGGLTRLFDSAGSLGSPMASSGGLGYAANGGSGAVGGNGAAAAAASGGGFDDMVESLLMLNMLNAQHGQAGGAYAKAGGGGVGVGAGSGSNGGGVIGSRPGVGGGKSGQREITSDFDLSLSSTGSSLDSPPQDAITTLTHLGLLSSDLAAAAAAGGGGGGGAQVSGAGCCQLHARTPLIESRSLANALGIPGCKVWLKLENSQPTGSFKIRGIGQMVRRAVERGCNQIISSSGGNAGLAAAYAANKLGVACTVVLPETTPEEMRSRITDEGAQVLVHGSVWKEAHAKAESLAAGGRAALVHPYDHEDIWSGHSSMIDEIAEALNGEQPDGLVLAVGGGGLLCGCVLGLWRYGWLTTPVFAAETHGANCLSAAVAAGKPVPLPGIASRATSLGATQLCQRAWDCLREHPVHSVLCSDEEAAQASLSFLRQHQMLTELACGAALAAVYRRRVAAHQLAKAQPANLVVVVCGGRNVSVEQLAEVAGSESSAAA